MQFWTRGGEGGVGVVMKVFSAEVDSGDDSTNLDGESNDNLISDNTMPSAASNTRSGKEWDQGQKKNIFFTKSMYVPYIV